LFNPNIAGNRVVPNNHGQLFNQLNPRSLVIITPIYTHTTPQTRNNIIGKNKRIPLNININPFATQANSISDCVARNHNLHFNITQIKPGTHHHRTSARLAIYNNII
jgi:hypothetical protein